MKRALIALAGLLLAAGCGGDEPPAELAGLWSANQAACAAGVGVQFGPRAIAAVYREQREVLFGRPRYRVESRNPFRVRILYQLPRPAGGARSGAFGELVLVRDAEGGLAPARHAIVDARTGAARVRIADDPAAVALTLEPCGPNRWRGGLRGLSAR